MAGEISFFFSGLDALLFCELNLRLGDIVNLGSSLKKFLEVKRLCKFF
ncbi:hypothetical protein Thena_0421 [Thermodesulfobium narugense DSM 14796]|uniref:Uncharacterized protein n=1 Tax=Thermodesulfobium narugense DSM 14796 TaxID=747365 RepID=M1E6A0_9BACT|nr:hypothetical protein [Thermodesulfobium narugense]AEE14063.1 hypothetical protein Thena_0421 [Thermodesulfobium narugense DSM 14796]